MYRLAPFTRDAVENVLKLAGGSTSSKTKKRNFFFLNERRSQEEVMVSYPILTYGTIPYLMIIPCLNPEPLLEEQADSVNEQHFFGPRGRSDVR